MQHEHRRLRKHASRGNINGMENFLDIFTTLIRLLYVYFKRGVVRKSLLISGLCRYLQLATVGKDSEEETVDGYLHSVYSVLDGDVGTMQTACDEAGYLAEVRAALLIAQSVRFVPNEDIFDGPKPTRPRQVLQTYAKAIAKCIEECHLEEPELDGVRLALENYRMFSATEIEQLLKELPNRLQN